MIPKKMTDAVEKATSRMSGAEPLKLIDVEVEDVTFYMPDGAVSYRLGRDDRMRVLGEGVEVTKAGETIQINPQHIYRMSRVKRIIKVPEAPYVPPAAQ